METTMRGWRSVLPGQSVSFGPWPLELTCALTDMKYESSLCVFTGLCTGAFFSLSALASSARVSFADLESRISCSSRSRSRVPIGGGYRRAAPATSSSTRRHGRESARGIHPRHSLGLHVPHRRGKVKLHVTLDNRHSILRILWLYL